METTTIEKIKKGDYFRRVKNVGGQLSKTKTVWIAAGYNRFAKKYAGQSFDDINRYIHLKKGTTVEINFDF